MNYNLEFISGKVERLLSKCRVHVFDTLLMNEMHFIILFKVIISQPLLKYTFLK